MRFEEVQAQWARQLIESLVRAGVSRAIVSPGSRSTPFVIAALDHPGLECRWIVDERSAAFFAVAQGKMTDEATLIICTSGSALGNYMPAVIEASQSFVPLLILSCDRPFELMDCGANQTIDQHNLFGAFSRGFFELGEATARPAAIEAMQRRAERAVSLTRHPLPGVVQINARARKPLEPGSERVARRDQRIDPRRGPLVESPPTTVVSSSELGALAEVCSRFERGLIVCGPGPIRHRKLRSMVEELARGSGYPICADGASQFRFTGVESSLRLDSFAAGLSSAHYRRLLRCDIIIQIGDAPTAPGWGSFLDECSPAHYFVMSENGWFDAEHKVTRFLHGDLVRQLDALALGIDASVVRSEWPSGLREIEQQVQQVISKTVEDQAGLSEGSLVRTVVASSVPGSLLALGNSLAIRDLDLFCPGSSNRLSVWSQRGASGIDGLLSGAAGAASVFDGATTLLIGDVSFVHDLSGSTCLRGLDKPLVVVIIQNGGGRIFDLLPVSDWFENGAAENDFWSTPTDADFEGIAAFHGLPFVRVYEAPQLAEEHRRALVRPGTTLIEAVVPPASVADERRRLTRAIDRVLA